MSRTSFKHEIPMFGRWHRLLFTSQERRIRYRQARSDYGHIKVDFTFTCYVLPVSNRLPHNQNSRVVPYACAFHCMVELVTRSIIEIKAGSTDIITNSSHSSVKKFPTSYKNRDSLLCSRDAATRLLTEPHESAHSLLRLTIIVFTHKCRFLECFFSIWVSH